MFKNKMNNVNSDHINKKDGITILNTVYCFLQIYQEQSLNFYPNIQIIVIN